MAGGPSPLAAGGRYIDVVPAVWVFAIARLDVKPAVVAAQPGQAERRGEDTDGDLLSGVDGVGPYSH